MRRTLIAIVMACIAVLATQFTNASAQEAGATRMMEVDSTPCIVCRERHERLTASGQGQAVHFKTISSLALEAPSDRRWQGALIGALGGGLMAMALNRVTAGACDDTDAHVTCPVVYTVVFGIGAVPGGVIGYIIGKRRK